ncbi:MAG: AAA family ATPase [Chloroflexi bacterium]|nr:AAA family ATPase [Chloroflexota bacterium]
MDSQIATALLESSEEDFASNCEDSGTPEAEMNTKGATMTETDSRDKAANEGDSHLSSLFEAVFHHLEGLTPESKQWDSAAALSADLMELLTRKKKESEELMRTRVRELLGGLNKLLFLFPELTKFEVENLALVDSPRSELDSLANQAESLQQMLARYEALCAPRDPHAGGTIARLQEQLNLAKEIVATHGRIHTAVVARLRKLDHESPPPQESPSPSESPPERRSESPVPLEKVSDPASSAGTPLAASETTAVSPAAKAAEDGPPAETGFLPPGASETPERETGTKNASVPVLLESGQVQEIHTVPASGGPEQADPNIAPASALSDTGKPPSGTVATLPQADKSQAEADLSVRTVPSEVTGYEVFWRMLVKGDISGCYWLAYSWEKLGHPTPVPTWLLASYAGSRWLAQGADRIANDLFMIAHDHDLQNEDQRFRPLGVASSLLPALTHPETGLQSWLLPLGASLQVMNPVIDEVRTFVNQGLSVSPVDVRTSESGERLEEDIARISGDTQEWLQRARASRKSYARATTVLRHLADADKSPLGQMLEIVASDRRKDLERVSKDLGVWVGPSAIGTKVREAAKSVIPVNVVIVGKANRELVRATAEAVGLVQSWCAACRKWQNWNNRSDDWRKARITGLLTGLRGSLPGSMFGTGEIAGQGPDHQRAMAAALHTAVKDLDSFFRGVRAELRVPPFAECGLHAGLSFRLLHCSGIELVTNEGGFPAVSSASLETLNMSLLERPATEEDGYQSLVKLLVGKEDFRWVSAILPFVTPDEERQSLERSVQTAEDETRTDLRKKVEQVNNRIEKAMAEGAFDADEHSDFSAALEETRRFLEQPNSNLGGARNRLEDELKRIELLRDEVLKERQGSWEALRPEMEKRLVAGEMNRLAGVVNDALNRRDIFTLDELLPTAQHSVALGDNGPIRRLLTSWSDPVRKPNCDLEDFFAAREKLLDMLDGQRITLSDIEGGMKTDSPHPFLKMDKLPKPRLKESSDAVAAWRLLKAQSSPGSNPLEESKRIGTILGYLGFHCTESPSLSGTMQRHDRNWSFWQFATTIPECPIQHFGSLTNGSIAVLCVWERPGPQAIQTILRGQQLQRQPILILYLGRLLARQWQDTVHHAQQEELSAIVLDELLLLFLAREYEFRLLPFFQCALPISAINPYVPYVGGNVPREMFFGRRQQLTDILDPNGSAFVYGGRQLGKSSLLRQAEAEFHNPSKGRYSVYLDIKNLGTPGSLETPELLWGQVAEALSHKGFLKKRLPQKPETIRQKLQDILGEGNKGILLLLDEADHFLTADAVGDFKITHSLKSLMDSTKRKFKVVFAGLHDVQRFSQVPNQPLAHLGTPILVGPLEARYARELIERPMEALGFRFREEEAIFRILSLTNYHPGLLQIFCFRLARALRERRVTPPYCVTIDDVDAIARDPDLRQEIKQRFILTLALDKHYSVLVRAMVLDQISQEDGYSKTYSVGDLLELGRSWWEKGFQNVSNDELRAYTSELAGLWVLAQADNGRYRLRSPNLARLLGTKEDIEGELEKYLDGKEEPEEDWQNADEIHPRIRSGLFSPLTQGQVRHLGIAGANASGLSLIFGSELTGLNRVPETVEAICQLMGENAEFRGLTKPVLSWQQLQQTISDMSSSAVSSKVVVCASIEGSATGLANLIERILSETARRGHKQRCVRIILLVGAMPCQTWLTLGEEERRGLELQAGSVVLTGWSPPAIKRWLEDNDLPANPEDAALVATVTDSRHYLMVRLLEFISEERGRRSFGDILKTFGSALCDRDSNLSKSLIFNVAGR